jgi:hypothetical protein
MVSGRGRVFLALGSEGAADEKSAVLSVAPERLGAAASDRVGQREPPTYPAPSAGEPPVKGATAADPEGVDGRGAGAWIKGVGG